MSGAPAAAEVADLAASSSQTLVKERSGTQQQRELQEDLVKGRYVLGEVIGSGANSCVIRGTDVVTQTTVAVKRMMCDSTRTQIEEWLKEVNILRRLNHPNVVKYLDHAQTSTYLYIMMEFAQKRSLQSAIAASGRMAEVDCVRIVRGLIRALSYLHSLKLVHRDVKAGNILLDSSGDAVLTDFGLALASQEKVGGEKGAGGETGAEGSGTDISPEATQELVGSVYWMAPELVSNAQPATAAADIWAVGCVVIEMLTTKPPFFDRTPYNALFTLAQNLESPIPAKLTMSPPLRGFLNLCFQRDPARRASAEQLLQSEWLSMVIPCTSPTMADSSQTVQPASITAAWVSDCVLFPMQREEWLRRGGLQSVVAALSDLQASEAARVVNVLASTARSLSGDETSEFFAAIGRTSLWTQLLVLCRSSTISSPKDVCELFCACCANQKSPQVPHAQLAATQGGIAAELLLHEETRAATMKALRSVAVLAACDAQPTRGATVKPLAVWMLEGGVLQAIAKTVEAPSGLLLDAASWEWVDDGCECIFLLTLPEVSLLTQTFNDDILAVVTEACQRQCPSAIRLLLRLTQVSTEYVVQCINVQVFLQIASDPELTYAIRCEVARCFPILQATDIGRIAFADPTLSVPLLGHILNAVPPEGSPDTVLPVFIDLCERDEMFAAACSDNNTIFRTILNKLSSARAAPQRPSELEHVLVLLRIIFSYAVRPEVFVKCNELTASLAKTLQEQQWPAAVHRESAALLDAFSALTKIV